MLMLHENLEFSIDEESLINSIDDGEINVLSAVATFMRRNLNRNQGYHECSLPAYSMRYKLHFYARNTCSHRATYLSNMCHNQGGVNFLNQKPKNGKLSTRTNSEHCLHKKTRTPFLTDARKREASDCESDRERLETGKKRSINGTHVFHLQTNRNFRKFFVNGKKPLTLLKLLRTNFLLGRHQEIIICRK